MSGKRSAARSVVMNVLIWGVPAPPELAVSLSGEAVSVVHFYDVKCVKP